MAPKALLVLATVLMVALLLVSYDVSAAAAAEEQQQLTKDAAAVVGQATGAETTVVGGVGESKQRRCRCCWFYLGRCQRYCCSNGEVFSAAEWESNAEPKN